jgi:soluble lytic murein transglycosylase-like protein
MRLTLSMVLVIGLVGVVSVDAATWERVGDTDDARRYFSRPDRRLIIDAGLARAGIYWEHARPFAQKYGIPEDLFFGLALGESAFNPFARSSAGAEGMFQFMPSTGRSYGLHDRRDRCSVIRSASAAARHLRDLEAQFGSWDLALAAYNAGAGRVESAIRRAGSRDWERVRVHLPTQTFSYVPKVRYLAGEEYSIFVEGSERPSRVHLAAVEAGDTLWGLARRYGVSVEALQRLNGSQLFAGTSIVVPAS